MLTWAIAFACWAMQDKAPMIFAVLSIPADVLIVAAVVDGLKRRKQ
jgi:hypothetical protein